MKQYLKVTLFKKEGVEWFDNPLKISEVDSALTQMARDVAETYPDGFLKVSLGTLTDKEYQHNFK